MNTNELAFDENGVKDLTWPISRDELNLVRDTALKSLTALCRSDASQLERDLLRILMVPLIVEIIGKYRASALSLRLQKTNSNSSLAPMLLPETVSDSVANTGVPKLLEQLVSGVPQHRRVGRDTLYHTRVFLEWNGLGLGKLLRRDQASGITTIQRLPLIDHQARASKQIVRLKSRSVWFPNILGESERFRKEFEISSTFLDKALSAVNESFSKSEGMMTREISDYFSRWLSTGLSNCGARLTYLTSIPDKVPTRLWTGHGGSVWTRILRNAVRLTGGENTGFEHAQGQGHLVTPVPSAFEFESCDFYVTSSVANRRGLEEGMQADFISGPKLPTIITPDDKRQYKSEYSIFSDKRKGMTSGRKIRSVMYLPMFYAGERIHFTPMIPDIVQIDWQYRLINKMQGWGYDMLLKPHPASSIEVPSEFIDGLGANLLTQSFEEIADTADAFLFEYSSTNTFGLAIATGKPVILINHGYETYSQTAREVLSRRCSFVEAWFDERNRLQVIWDELRESIEVSRALNDPSYMEQYLA